MSPPLEHGVGTARNALDGDLVRIEVDVRGEELTHLAASDIRTTGMAWVDGARRRVAFSSGAEARAHGDETFVGCETARKAALALPTVALGRRLDEVLGFGPADVLPLLHDASASERCVATVLEATRNAIRDVRMTRVARATVERRHL